MPGYLPDSEPVECETWQEAKAYIREELIRHAEEESEAAELGDKAKKNAAKIIRIETRQCRGRLRRATDKLGFGSHAGKYFWWINRERR